MKQKKTEKEIVNVKPEIKFRAGGVTATIWGKDILIDKRKVHILNVQLEKSFTMDEGKTWETTNNYNRDDLIKVQEVLKEAIHYCYMKSHPEE